MGVRRVRRQVERPHGRARSRALLVCKTVPAGRAGPAPPVLRADDCRGARVSTIFRIKLLHTVIFWILSACVVYALYSGVVGDITAWTGIAVGLLLAETAVLAASGWTCPLTRLAERHGATSGSVADIFLPKVLADRIFPVCGTLFVVALVLILVRWLG